MKAKFFLAAMIVLVSTAAFSNGPGPRVAVVSQKSANLFKVIYEGNEVGKVKMTILNKNQEVVFAETTPKINGFIRKVNFEGMTPGEYTIQIADKDGLQSQTITYAKKTAVKNIQVSKMANEAKYLLSVACPDGKEQILVRIYDGAKTLVHSEYRTVEGSLGLVFNLSNVEGVPTFEVADNSGAVKTIKY